MALHELETNADRGLLATLRALEREGEPPPTSEVVAGAVGIPEVYSEFIEQRLEENERRGFVTRDGEGRWLLTPEGTALAS
jgi:hypothetical protein